MPIYEYTCQACGLQTEALQKVSDDPLKDCPECGKATLKKNISSTSFQLKGTGWYVTDFRDKDKAKPKADDKKGAEAKKDIETKENKKTAESKSETKPKSKFDKPTNKESK